MAAYLGLKELIADKPCTDTVSFQPKLTVSPESQAMQRTIVEKINEGIAIIQNNYIVFVNKRMADILGYKAEEISGCIFSKIFDQMEIDRIIQYYTGSQSEKTSEKPFETMMFKKNGSSIDVEIRYEAIDWKKHPAILILIRDTSEQKKLEALLLRAQKMEGMVNLTRNFAHDFNNILQPISGYAQILSMNKDNSDPDYRKLEMILRSVRKGEELIKQLLTNIDELVKNQN